MRTAWTTTLAVVLAAGAIAAVPPAAAAPKAAQHASVSTTVGRGADVSWPNCPKGLGIPSRKSPGEPMPTANTSFVIVGLTNGPGFFANPCIARELRWVNTRQLRVGAYSMTTYPTKTERQIYGGAGPYTHAAHAALRNAAYAEALFNTRTITLQHLVVPMIWVDVEPYPVDPWTHNQQANRLVVQAVIHGYRSLGYPVGIYTYANGWKQVVGHWKLPTIPTWATVGGRGKRKALASCTTGPSGGRTLIAQWYDPHRDYDLVCPSARANPGTLFSGT